MIDRNPKDIHLLTLISQFEIVGKPLHIQAFGSGHINDTYRVVTDQPKGEHYLLQKINHHVFKNVAVLMRNIQLVCAHIRERLIREGASAVDRKVMTPVVLRDKSAHYLVDHEGNYWRVFVLIGDTKSYDIVETEQQAFEGGLAFGNFQRLLSDMDPETLKETIPDFLNIETRLKRFREVLSEDVLGRAAQAKGEIRFILERGERMSSILDSAGRGLIPLRITHNDTKFNNVLLDRSDHFQCVIDLDTVMPGYVAYDFGDAIRTIINRAAEDEEDLQKIQLNIPLFNAFTKGYLQEVSAFILPAELDSLIDGVLLLPYMQAVRFLTDYLEGDHYYKTSHSGHNLQRTRAQVKLVQEVESAERELRRILQENYGHIILESN